MNIQAEYQAEIDKRRGPTESPRNAHFGLPKISTPWLSKQSILKHIGTNMFSSGLFIPFSSVILGQF